MHEDSSKTNMNKEEWKKKLTPEQYAITCEGSTEPAFSGKYLNNHETGMYKYRLLGKESLNVLNLETAVHLRRH